VIEAWADRTAALSQLPGIEQVFPFENRGEAIGVTLHHPHGQIYYPYVTPRTPPPRRDRPHGARPVRASSRPSSRPARPAAASTGRRSCRSPRAGRSSCTSCRTVTCPTSPATDAERDELAPFYLRLLRGIDALYDTPTPYIAAWHQAPCTSAATRCA
jgi:UDPglucose--hexose-1-phosphate uridylyltransferase